MKFITIYPDDTDERVRRKGIALILEMRRRLAQDPYPPCGIHAFYVPHINVDANHYSEMIKLERPSGDVGHIYFMVSQIPKQ